MSTYSNNTMKAVVSTLLLLVGMCVVFTAPAVAIEQHIKNGATGVIHTGAGNINITGYTPEQHEKALKERESSIRKDLKKLYQSKNKNLSLEKQLLERKLSDVEGQLQNLASSYQKRIKFLENTISELRAISDEGDGHQTAEAILALQQGDTDKADQLFKQIEEKEKSAIERAAKAAFERGKIAEANIDYRNAYLHFERAVGLTPDNPEYLDIAGAMAGTVANHQKEIEWEEKALAIYLKQNGTDSPNVASLRNSLGIAWHSLGQYEKAIEYYELALASALSTFDEDHPKVATYRNNLGSAWGALGQYEKATEYYELALATLEKVRGADHPTTKTVARNLASAQAAR